MTGNVLHILDGTAVMGYSRQMVRALPDELAFALVPEELKYF